MDILGADVPELHAAVTACNEDLVEVRGGVVDHYGRETGFKLNGCLEL